MDFPRQAFSKLEHGVPGKEGETLNGSGRLSGSPQTGLRPSNLPGDQAQRHAPFASAPAAPFIAQRQVPTTLGQSPASTQPPLTKKCLFSVPSCFCAPNQGKKHPQVPGWEPSTNPGGVWQAAGTDVLPTAVSKVDSTCWDVEIHAPLPSCPVSPWESRVPDSSGSCGRRGVVCRRGRAAGPGAGRAGGHAGGAGGSEPCSAPASASSR